MTERCSERIWDWDSDGWHDHQCPKHVTVERDGKWYCKIHDPEYVKNKKAKKDAKYESERCKKCNIHLDDYWGYCPYCGTPKGVK